MTVDPPITTHVESSQPVGDESNNGDDDHDGELLGPERLEVPQREEEREAWNEEEEPIEPGTKWIDLVRKLQEESRMNRAHLCLHHSHDGSRKHMMSPFWRLACALLTVVVALVNVKVPMNEFVVLSAMKVPWMTSATTAAFVAVDWRDFGSNR